MKKSNKGIVEFGSLQNYDDVTIFDNKLKNDEIVKIVEVSKKLGVPPNWLVALIGFESDYTFNPAVTNKQGYTGLIQFGKQAAKDLGTTTDKLRRMSFIEQMNYVERYFTVVNKRYLKYVKNIEDLYCIIFYPLALTKPVDWVFGSERSLSFAKLVGKQNPVFRDENGLITRKSMNAGLRAFYKRYFPKYYDSLFN